MTNMNQSNWIVCHDASGRRVEVERSAFVSKVLIPEFQAAAQVATRLYGAIVMALKDEFFEESLEPARHLFRIDSDKERAATILGIVLMKLGKLGEAEQVLSAFLAEKKSGVVMTNLAKVYSETGREVEARRLLRDALAVDPNMDNALDWYLAIANEEGGQEGYLKAAHHIARERGSWRAQLWLARDFLEHGDVHGAMEIYKQIMSLTDIPEDAFIMMTGDMGNHRLIGEMISLLLPRYNENRHGVMAGCNMLQACVKLRRRNEGLELCNRLDKLERFDQKRWIDTQRAILKRM